MMDDWLEQLDDDDDSYTGMESTLSILRGKASGER